MNSPFGVSDHVYTEDQLADIREASELERMTQTPGWVRVAAFMADLVAVAQGAVAAVDTARPESVVDAVREYQAKNDFHKQIQLYIESAIQKREALAPRNQLELLILEEQLNGGSSHSGDPGA